MYLTKNVLLVIYAISIVYSSIKTAKSESIPELIGNIIGIAFLVWVALSVNNL